MAIKLRPIRDQVIVVTGAHSGIGLATARAAAKRGARVMLIAPEEAALGDIARAINNAGGRADYAVADGGDPAALAKAAQAVVARFGRVDTWVNGADDDAGAAKGCQAGVSVLRRQGGAMIAIGSAAVRADVDALRGEVRKQAPDISVTLIVLNQAEDETSPATDPQLVADAILRCAEHPRREMTVGAGTGFLAGHVPGLLNGLRAGAARPAVTAAVGLGGLALALGAFALRRRNKKA